MEKQTFNIRINATPEKVWNVLWEDASYRKWTAAFAEGSHAVTDWKKGSKVLFLDGKGMGMFSTIADNVPNRFMSFKHLGEVKDGQEMPASDWAGAMENYTLNKVNGHTELVVEMDINDEFKDYFTNTFPKALNRVKELAEE